MYKAWNFVRGVSSELGAQTEDVLNVQQNIDAMVRNLTFEQDSWTSRRDSLLASRYATAALAAQGESAL